MRSRTRFSTSFSTTAELYDALRNVAHELKISASGLICRAIQEYIQRISLNTIPTVEDNESSDKDNENAEESHGLL
ncbi:MAG TPA: hypothetical protein VEK32_06000 [Thermodesulfobacteriota bacterium]|nr:hypothetical protein [Thermodesulfobacteriota bacterium]